MKKGFIQSLCDSRFSKRKSYLSRSTGFTLIEILIYVAVLSIVVAVIFAFLNWSMESNNKIKSTREVLDNARRVMEIIGYETKEALSIYAPTATSTQLSLETTHYLPSGETQTYIDFYLCGGRICFKKEGENPISITSENVDVRNLEFKQVAATSSAPSLQISLQIDYKNPAGKPEYEASINTTSTFSIRSY